MQDKIIDAIGKLNMRIQDSIALIDVGNQDKTQAEYVKQWLLKAVDEKNDIGIQAALNEVNKL